MIIKYLKQHSRQPEVLKNLWKSNLEVDFFAEKELIRLVFRSEESNQNGQKINMEYYFYLHLQKIELNGKPTYTLFHLTEQNSFMNIERSFKFKNDRFYIKKVSERFYQKCFKTPWYQTSFINSSLVV